MRTNTKGPGAVTPKAQITRHPGKTIDVTVAREDPPRQLDTNEPAIPWPGGRMGVEVDQPPDRAAAIAELERLRFGFMTGLDRERLVAALAIELAPSVRLRARRVAMIAAVDRRRCVPPLGRDRVAELELFAVGDDFDDRAEGWR